MYISLDSEMYKFVFVFVMYFMYIETAEKIFTPACVTMNLTWTWPW